MRYKLNLEEIGERVRELRAKKHLTQEGVGMELGCNKNAISKIERGEMPNLTVAHLIDIANYFNVDVNYLLIGKTDIDTDTRTIFKSMTNEKKQIIKEFLENFLKFL